MLYKIVMVEKHHYAFVQSHRMYNTKVNPNVNDRLWAIMIYQHRFIVSDVSHCWEILIVGEVLQMWE